MIIMKIITTTIEVLPEKKNLWNVKVTVIPIVVGELEKVSKGLEKRLGDVGNQRENQNNPDHSFVKIS